MRIFAVFLGVNLDLKYSEIKRVLLHANMISEEKKEIELWINNIEMNQRENKVVQKLRNNRDFFNNEESRLFCVIFIFLFLGWFLAMNDDDRYREGTPTSEEEDEDFVFYLWMIIVENCRLILSVCISRPLYWTSQQERCLSKQEADWELKRRRLNWMRFHKREEWRLCRFWTTC